MRFGTTIAFGALLASTLGVRHAASQPPQAVPCQGCQSCQSGAPCGYPAHKPDCCCELCRQAPPNPLNPGRPSPPLCCADGICYPNYQTWGHYATRWRRWPIELAAVAPGVAPTPQPLGPDVPGYQAPPPEEEDRRAPPPSAPRGEPVPTTPRAAQPREGGEEPPEETPTPREGAQPAPTPEDIFGTPTNELTPPGLPPLPGAPTDEVPETIPLTPPTEEGSAPTTSPLEEPMGDLDPPPTPPFATRHAPRAPVIRPVVQPAAPAPRRATPPAPQDDPPPALPNALASVSH